MDLAIINLNKYSNSKYTCLYVKLRRDISVEAGSGLCLENSNFTTQGFNLFITKLF